MADRQVGPYCSRDSQSTQTHSCNRPQVPQQRVGGYSDSSDLSVPQVMMAMTLSLRSNCFAVTPGWPRSSSAA
jgi:hypothetical protein